MFVEALQNSLRSYSKMFKLGNYWKNKKKLIVKDDNKTSGFKHIHSPENESDFNLSEYSGGSSKEIDHSFNKELPNLSKKLRFKRKFKGIWMILLIK